MKFRKCGQNKIQLKQVKQRIIEKKYATEDELKSMDKDIREIVAKSAEFAQSDPLPDESELYTDILVEV